MGSVKDLKVLKTASKEEEGEGVFYFTDDYSVFDFGKMPDTIPNKGESICRASAYNFKELKKIGIKNHFIEMISGKEMKVKLVRVLFPQKNEIQENDSNYLIPLEMIFRNSLPKGSSVFRRVEKGQTSWEKLGLDFIPEPGTKLDSPILDVSTKLEPQDRYLSWEEAQKISMLTDNKMKELKQKTLKINDWITKKALELNLEHADGKVEFAIDSKGDLILVDVVGTLDENRMLFNKTHISKQVLRNYYATTPWAEIVKKDPKTAPIPEKLPKELIDIVSNMYMGFAESWMNEKIWNSKPLNETVNKYKEFIARM